MQAVQPTAAVVHPAREGRVVVHPSSPASQSLVRWLWDLTSGIEIAGFYGDRSLSVCCIPPDGKTIVAGDATGRMHFLRIEGMD